MVIPADRLHVSTSSTPSPTEPSRQSNAIGTDPHRKSNEPNESANCDEHARECNFDVHVMFEQMRAETERLKAEGWKVLSLVIEQEPSAVVRDDPPKKQAFLFHGKPRA